MPGNPAQVDRKTGELFINPYSWETMPESMRRFILLHEEGHLKGGQNGGPTENELKADLYAFRQFKHTEPNSLKKSVVALDMVLGKSPEHIKRKLLIYSAALLEDWHVNKNPKAIVEYHNIKGELEQYHGISGLPEVSSDKSNFVAIAGLIISAAVTGYQMYSKSKASNDAQAQQDAYNVAVQTQLANQNLQNIYNIEKQKDKAKESSINTKYILGISLVLGVAILSIWYYIKKK